MRQNAPEKQDESPHRRDARKSCKRLNGLSGIPHKSARGVAAVDLPHIPDYLLG